MRSVQLGPTIINPSDISIIAGIIRDEGGQKIGWYYTESWSKAVVGFGRRYTQAVDDFYRRLKGD